MGATRRRSVPVVLLLWVAILACAFGLNRTRPAPGDPRWYPQWHAYDADGEGMFYAWSQTWAGTPGGSAPMAAGPSI
jgi:hypothetical protein